MTFRGAWVAAAAMLAVAAGAPPAQAAEADFTLCASCHGMGGVSYNPDTPSLAGQHSFYAITQLFLFRAGRRTNEAMTEVAKRMSDADLRAYSELIGRLPPAAPAAARTAKRAARHRVDARLLIGCS